jgi:hypothetical protein
MKERLQHDCHYNWFVIPGEASDLGSHIAAMKLAQAETKIPRCARNAKFI